VPRPGLIRRQAGDIGEIEIAAFSPATATSCRACFGIEPDGSERLSADTAVSGTQLHKRLSQTEIAHIYATAEAFKEPASATAAMSLCLWRSYFCENRPLLDASREAVKSWRCKQNQ
jgi:hypothetical protein